MPEFDRLWSDLKKHKKRRDHWLPRWKEQAAAVGKSRPVRFFTLCARPMIDVFMLLREGLLPFDVEGESIGSIFFCECERDQYSEIREMIGREDAGFFGRIEDLALFRDSEFTRQFSTLDDIALKLEEAENLSDKEVEGLNLKRTHLNIRASFPYDCINLDFCGYYYPPPGMLRINQTVEKILEWQFSPSTGGGGGEALDSFILSVTCRHDSDFPKKAADRLKTLIKNNCSEYGEYKNAYDKSRKGIAVDRWADRNPEDFFLTGWPKDIASSAKQRGWTTDILDCVFYRRKGYRNHPYAICSLVIKFSRVSQEPEYLPAVLRALDIRSRTHFNNIPTTSSEGKRLLQDLREIVILRNEQARRKKRAELPNP